MFHYIKIVHISCITLTFFSFTLRGFWMLTDSPLLHMRSVKIIPHFIDTVLLATGLTLALSLYDAFYREGWLMLKLMAMVLYIVLGGYALNYGKTKLARAAAFVSALCIFFFIIVVARYHTVYFS